MASLLKELSLAIGLLSSDHVPQAVQAGWTDYVWTVVPVDACPGAPADCVRQDGTWDWKRDERYRYSASVDAASNRISTRIVLDNRDPADSDHVCVAALFYDGAGRDVAVDFAVIDSRAGEVTEKQAVLLPSRPVSAIAEVAIGTKQCDPDFSRDVELARSVRSTLRQQ